MKTLFFALATMLATTTVQATGYVCQDPTVQDAALVAEFPDVDAASPAVSLFVPSGETSGRYYIGGCSHDRGAIEFSMSCTVHTRSDATEGYDVKLFSFGGSQLHASITRFSMATVLHEAEILPCTEIE